MAKKRKSLPNSEESAASQQLNKQIKLEQETQQQQEQLQQLQATVDDVEVKQEEEDEDNTDVGDGDEGVEEEEEEGEEEEGDEEEEKEDDDDPIENLLEPFTKEQLVSLLTKAAETHSDVASEIKRIANEDTVHRKIFVHGLGWDSTADTLRTAFSEFGEIEDCKAVTDKVSGKSKGYGFILFKTRAGARRALQQPQKKIGNRMTACQLAAVGPGPSSSSSAQMTPQQPASEFTQRKIYVSNVSADLDPQKLTAFFSKFGEIEEGPLGLDKVTGKPKGFCLFVYRSAECARKALEEPHKHYEGHILHCQRAIDGPKVGKHGFNQHHRGQGQGQGQQYGGRNDNNPNLAGAIGGAPVTGAGLMGQSVGVGGVPYHQGGAAPSGINPALGQALTALLASQGAGLGLNNLLGTFGGGIAAPAVGGAHAMQGGYGSQMVAGAGMNPGVGVLGGYGAQVVYPNQQMGQGGAGRSQHGHMGGVAPYNGH